MKTLAVVVTGQVSFIRSATFLIDVEDDDAWEDAIDEALARATRGVEVEWHDVPTRQSRWNATIPKSVELADLVTLLTAMRDGRVLDANENAWLEELQSRVTVSDREILRFLQRQPTAEPKDPLADWPETLKDLK
jgi:hypothetical protein